MMKVKVYRPDGTFYEIDDPGFVPELENEAEPTTEDILNAMLGVN